MTILPIDQRDRAPVDAFITRQWFTPTMVVHGEVIDLTAADGWYVPGDGGITGLITYRVAGREMEILSLDSLREREGIGTALLGRAVAHARDRGCARVWLVTTNDNLNALRFYQKRGFDLIRLHRNAVERARRLKPKIPPLGDDGIPIRHELELEMPL